jgi:peptide/nickel transport system substrate-binding protein
MTVDPDPRANYPGDGRSDRREFIKRTAALGISTSVAGEFLAKQGVATAATRRRVRRSAAKTVVVAAVSTPPTLDWEYMAGTPASWEVGENLYGTKIMYKTNRKAGTRDFTKFEGRLVERMEESADGKSWKLHLRRGVTNHLGDEMTTDGLDWHWKRAFALKAVGAFDAAQMNIQKTRALDKYTFEYVLSEPSLIVRHFSTSGWDPIFDLAEVMKHTSKTDPWAKPWLANHAAGFGAYWLEGLTAGQEAVLRANTNYWQGKPDVDTVFYKAIPEAASRLALLTRGDADIALSLSATDLRTLKGNPKISIYSAPGNNVIGVFMNLKVPPLEKTKVRQALAYATPYQEVLSIYKGTADPIKSYIPQIFPGYTSKYYPYKTDYDKAKALLKEAGVKTPINLKLTYAQFKPESELTAIALRGSFAKIGVNLTLDLVSPAKFSEISFSRKGELILAAALRVGYMDALFGFEVFAGQGIRGILNYGNYYNPRVQRLFQIGEKARTVSRRLEIARAVQKEFAADPPWLVIGTERYTVAHSTNVSGFIWTPNEGLVLNELSKK